MPKDKTLFELVEDLKKTDDFQEIIPLLKDISINLYDFACSLEGITSYQQRVITNLNLRLKTLEDKKS